MSILNLGGNLTTLDYYLLRIWIVTTNLTMLLPIYQIINKYYRKRVFEIFIFLNVLIWSSFYHMCDNNPVSFCILPWENLYLLDFSFSVEIIPICLLNFIAEKNTLYKIFVYFIWFITSSSYISLYHTGIYFYLYIIVSGFIITIGRVIFLYYRKLLPVETYKNMKKKNAGISLIFYTFALVFFGLDWIYAEEAIYYVFHGFWHITIMFAIYFTMKIYDPSSQFLSRIGSHPRLDSGDTI